MRTLNANLCFVAAALVLALPAHAQSLSPWTAAAAPPLDLETLAGAKASVASVRDGTVVVHFFATWCAPCEEELRELNLLAQTPRATILTIFAVSVGEPRARVERYFNAAPVAFPVLLDPGKTAMRAWGVDVLPSTFILSPGLCPAFKSGGVVTWTAKPVLAALQTASARTPSSTCNN